LCGSEPIPTSVHLLT